MWYAVDGVLILNEIVEPALTLIDVAKPWIDGSPAPFTNQSEVGSPGSWFSHAMRDKPSNPRRAQFPRPDQLPGTRPARRNPRSRRAKPNRPGRTSADPPPACPPHTPTATRPVSFVRRPSARYPLIPDFTSRPMRPVLMP